MAYTKTTWIPDETVVSAALLNHMEDGIAANDAAVTDAVMFSAQELTDDQQAQARSNIGAAAQSDMTTAQTALASLQTAVPNLASVIENTASGAVASFTDGAAAPIKQLTAQVKAAQSFNGYDYPWAPGGGRNLLENNFPGRSTQNYTLARNNDGTFTLNATLTASTVIIFNFALNDINLPQNDLKKHLPNGTYFLTTNNTRGYITMQVCASNSESSTSDIKLLFGSKSGTVTIDDTYKYNWVRLVVNAGTYTNEVIAPVACLSTETDTSYVPYSNICPIAGWTGAEIYVSPTTSAAAGTTYNVTFPAGAGTVYGGTLAIHEDGSGTLISTHALLTMDGSTTGKKFSNKSGAANYDEYLLAVADGYTFGISGSYVPQADANANGLICSVSPYYDFTSPYRITFTAYISASSGLQLRLRFALGIGYDTLEAANQFLADLYAAGTPVEFCYPLKEATTYELTAEQVSTILGENHVWADTGNVSLTYRADTKLYIDARIAEALAQGAN